MTEIRIIDQTARHLHFMSKINGSNSNSNSNSKGRGRSRGSGGKRSHGRGNGFGSSGGRNNGNAQQLMDKYLSLARDAASQGDRIATENFYQHADHYYRVVFARNEQQEARRKSSNGNGSDAEQVSNNEPNNSNPELSSSNPEPSSSNPEPSSSNPEPSSFNGEVVEVVSLKEAKSTDVAEVKAVKIQVVDTPKKQRKDVDGDSISSPNSGTPSDTKSEKLKMGVESVSKTSSN